MKYDHGTMIQLEELKRQSTPPPPLMGFGQDKKKRKEKGESN